MAVPSRLGTAQHETKDAERTARLHPLWKCRKAQPSGQISSGSIFCTTVSEGEVRQGLVKFNEQMEQGATYMADELVNHFQLSENVTNNPTEEYISAVKRAPGPEHIGRVLAASLSTKARAAMRTLLPVAFQTYLVSVLCPTGCNITPPVNSVNRRLIKPEAAPLPQAIIAAIADILLAAGCTTARLNIISEVGSWFEEKIVSLVNVALRLNKMLDRVNNLEVFIAQPGEEFKDESMEAKDLEETADLGPVLCATSMGLVRQVILMETGRKKIVLKAKVILESFLEYL